MCQVEPGGKDRPGQGTAKRLGPLADLFPHQVVEACRIPFRDRAGRRDDPELLGSGHRQGAQQQAVDDAEDRGVGADREGQRQDGDGGEARRASEGAHGVARIVPEIVETRFPAGGAHVILDGCGASELDSRGARRGVAAQAGLHVPLDRRIEIGAEFLVQVVLDAIAVEERADPANARG